MSRPLGIKEIGFRQGYFPRHWRDTGCRWFSSCFLCKFPRCYYEMALIEQKKVVKYKDKEVKNG